MTRIDKKFTLLRQEKRPALVTFITAGDPNREICEELLTNLPEAGADIIELGMPFSDPMADGPSIQASSERAIKAGATLEQTLDIVASFREKDQETPLVLMGYYNPIYFMGVELFLKRARAAGVDGLIIVDLPPEADEELCLPAITAGINFIRLVAPTTDDMRLPKLIKNSSGFVYFISIAGITGTHGADLTKTKAYLQRIRGTTDLPITVGFGIRTPEQAAQFAFMSDGVVVGSAIVDKIKDNLDAQGKPKPELVGDVLHLVRDLSAAIKDSHSNNKEPGTK